MKQQYMKLETFIDVDLVNKVLLKDHIVKKVTFKHKVRYAECDGFGGFDMDTVKDGSEPMTREVAIPKSTPDLVITEDNYGDYQSGMIFDRIFMKKLVEIVTKELL
jgi:hypothetical protein